MGPEGIARADYDYLADSVSGGGKEEHGEKARAFLRKPQYVYGWDWGPRVGTVGIMKNAWIVFLNDMTITRLHPVTLEAKLWWPNGAGEQPLYTAELTIKSGKNTVNSEPVRFGIRTAALNIEQRGKDLVVTLKSSGYSHAVSKVSSNEEK